MDFFHKTPITSGQKRGFTLIELLIIIAIIAILTTVVFVALNPLARFQDARNSRRWTDVNAILSAIKLDQVDNGGSYLSEITDLTDSLYFQIGATSDSNCDDCLSVNTEMVCADISDLSIQGYLPTIPIDPNATDASAKKTKYYIMKNLNGSIEVGACVSEKGSAETAPMIKATR